MTATPERGPVGDRALQEEVSVPEGGPVGDRPLREDFGA